MLETYGALVVTRGIGPRWWCAQAAANHERLVPKVNEATDGVMQFTVDVEAGAYTAASRATFGPCRSWGMNAMEASRQIGNALALALLLLISANADAQQPTLIVTGADVVNVRIGPSTETDVLQRLGRGAQLRAVGRVGEWYVVQIDEQRQGFILGTLVTAIDITAPAQSDTRTPSGDVPPAGAIGAGFGLVGLLVGLLGFRSRRAARAVAKRLRLQLESSGALSVIELEERRNAAQRSLQDHERMLSQRTAEVEHELKAQRDQLSEIRKTIVVTEELALLQEAGVYKYRHPLSDIVAYEKELLRIEHDIREMVKKDGGAVLSATDWTVNGSKREGRTMLRNFSKLMLRAFNAEADNLVRTLRPYKLDSALARLRKVSETIAKLGETMHIRVSTKYLRLRESELELTADFLQKQEEIKDAERAARDQAREERKAVQEMERAREKLEKERQHYQNALQAVLANGDEHAAAELRARIEEVRDKMEDVENRAANQRAGYVYVISNIGSFGEGVVKIGMTRRLDPEERIRELSDASVPFNFDIHALFFSEDAVGIETKMHQRLAETRVNVVNRRREFFRATPTEVRAHLSALAGQLLEFHEVAEALEYRQCIGGAPKPEGSVAAA